MSPDKKTLVKMYETMSRIRLFETKLQEFFAAGRIPGFVHLYIGEEAVATGACAGLTTPTRSPAPTVGTGISSPRAAT